MKAKITKDMGFVLACLFVVVLFIVGFVFAVLTAILLSL